METASVSFGKENGDIFDYQLLLLEDMSFLGKIKEIIETEQVNCEYAVDSAARQYIELFENMDNDYLKERTVDLADIAKRLNFILRGKELKTLSDIREDSIVAAADLTPSQTAGINRKRVKGILLEHGGISSHSVIIARSMGIPCIIGIPGLLNNVAHGETVMINSDSGEVIKNPTAGQIALYKAYEARITAEKHELDRYVKAGSITRDGFEVKVYANITSENDAAALIENGGEGAGLFRTEFLFMTGKNPPSEELQYKVYSNTARILDGRPLIIRTLDAGGDKNIPYLKIPAEGNPFLGYRAIRYCLDNPDIFKAQLSAILRAGLHGSVECMVPMIATIDELRRTRAMVKEVGEELAAKGIPYSDRVRLGIMVETPAAAVMADRFAEEADFLSIGTNDLTQYLFAADRMNPKVADLNSYFHPALLRIVKYVCDCANRKGIEVDICGQAGEIPALVPIWTAMGVNNLSVSIPSIPKVRKIICETRKADAAEIMEKALTLDTAKEVESFLKQQFRL